MAKKIKLSELSPEVQQMLRASGQMPPGGWHRKLTADLKRKYALRVLAVCADLKHSHRRSVLDLAVKINNGLTKV